jgi:hypothetical protein
LDREKQSVLEGAGAARVHPLHAKVSASLRLAITGKRLMLCNTVQYSTVQHGTFGFSLTALKRRLCQI